MSQLKDEYKKVSISLPRSIVDQIDSTCASEHRNRSEMLREAWRLYAVRLPRRRKLTREERRQRLVEALSRITPENKHELLDWGEPRGKEIW